MYEEIYVMCQNVEKVMEMFSKELIQLDRNTVQYMIDEMQDTIDVQKGKIDTHKEELEAKQETIDSQQATIDTQKEELEAVRHRLREMAEKLEQLRFLQAGIPVRVLEVPPMGAGVDTPEDLERVCAVVRKRRHEVALKKLKHIRLIITDVDGVLTDGGLYYGPDGECLKRFHAPRRP